MKRSLLVKIFIVLVVFVSIFTISFSMASSFDDAFAASYTTYLRIYCDGVLTVNASLTSTQVYSTSISYDDYMFSSMKYGTGSGSDYRLVVETSDPSNARVKKLVEYTETHSLTTYSFNYTYESVLGQYAFYLVSRSYDVDFDCTYLYSGSVPSSYSALTLSTLPVLSETGLSFQGWFYDENRTIEAHSGDSLTSDVTLFAKFVPDTVTSYQTGYDDAAFSTFSDFFSPLQPNSDGLSFNLLNEYLLPNFSWDPDLVGPPFYPVTFRSDTIDGYGPYSPSYESAASAIGSDFLYCTIDNVEYAYVPVVFVAIGDYAFSPTSCSFSSIDGLNGHFAIGFLGSFFDLSFYTASEFSVLSFAEPYDDLIVWYYGYRLYSLSDYSFVSSNFSSEFSYVSGDYIIDRVFNLGRLYGVSQGYQDAIEDSSAISSGLDFIGSLFSSVGSFINISIVPGITLGTLLMIPLIFMVLIFVFKLVRGG